MATIDYRDDVLPLPLLSGYGYSDDSRFIRTDMDSGYARQRLRFTQSPTRFNVSFLFTEGQMSYFESFFNNQLNFGIEFFNMDLAVGSGFTKEHEVRFISPYRVQLSGNLFRVTASIEAVEKQVDPLLNDDQLAYIAAQGGFEKAGISFDRIDLFVNTETKLAFS